MRVAALGDWLPWSVAEAAASLPPPAADDLAETVEVRFTGAIQTLAAELNHQPLQIYQWVRNNIEFVPTYGSIQGADYCLQTRQGNAFDTASLLIALLRVSNIPARYAYGTIEVPADKVMNWVGGVLKPEVAVEALNAGGIPAMGIMEKSKITRIRMEHVWVEEWIDYIPSRGAIHKVGDNWIPMDATFKQYSYTDGIDIQSAVPFDGQGFVDQVTSTAVINEEEGWVTGVDSLYIQQQMESYRTQVENYIGQNMPEATVGDVLGKKEIVKVRHGGSVVDCAVLVATGVREDGHRSVLGTSVSLSEAEVHWRKFLASLQERGMHGVIMVTSDDHKGLKEAMRARCHHSHEGKRTR